MTREERENAIRCLKLWIEKEPYIQTYKTCLEALEQSMPTMVYPQVDGITPTVVAQADGEKICGTCRNEDTYHCVECENKSDYEQSQADGDLISRQAVQNYIAHFLSLYLQDNVREAVEAIDEVIGDMPSVVIPSDHDGCKDCKYETYPEYYYPCCECKQNYMDEWQKKLHWIHRNDDYTDWLECPNCGYGSEGEVKYGEGTPFCPHCGERLENEN